MDKKMVIAVDGPAGAGKSSVAKIVAEKLQLEYVDSGAIYRSIAKIILDSKIKIEEYEKIIEILPELKIELFEKRVFVNGKDFTDSIRGNEVSLIVSPLSGIIPVRKKVNAFLNEYSLGKSIIMDGRDIGTVVFPNADYKFYLDASVEIRAKRRFDEKTLKLSLEDIKREIMKRDENDKNKEFGALKIAKDAVYIDTTGFTKDEVVEKILSYIKEK
jgi:cytidylate kinase